MSDPTFESGPADETVGRADEKATSDVSRTSAVSDGYRRYVLLALTMVFGFEVIDRILFSLVQESIKADLLISDFQLGLLGGPAFVILNSLAALPIAYFADRTSRVRIVSLGLGFWSFATAACGYAGSFLQLVIFRGMVGVGGAACLPPSQSIIADYYPVKKRASALALFGLAIPIGSMVAAVVGGGIAARYGWRAAFIFFGVLGIVAAVVLKLTVREPERAEPVAFDNPLVSLKEIGSRRSFIHVTLAAAITGLFTFASNQFLVSFMIRNYGLEIDVASFYFGVVIMAAMGLGIYCGGFVADKLESNKRSLAWVPLVGIVCSIPFFLLGFIQTSLMPMLACIAVASFFCYFYLSPTFAAVQRVGGATRRASATALFLTTSTLIGYGVGPPILGWIADRTRDSILLEGGVSPEQCDLAPGLEQCLAAGGEGLRLGLLVMVGFLTWGAIHFWLAGRSLPQDIID